MKKNFFPVMAMALFLPVWPSRAANVVMTAADALGTTSFNTGLHWSDGQPPAAGNSYQTGAYLLRTPAGAADVLFAGDSLEIQNGGFLRDKTAATVTITSLILAGGSTLEITQPNNVNNASATGSLAGTITLNGTAYLHAGIATDLPGETFNIQSRISGSGGFTTAGSTGIVVLSGTNDYSGGTTVNDGTLRINGVLVNSPVTIAGGTLGGNGRIQSPVTCQAGGVLQPGQGGSDTTTLTISNNLYLSGTTVMVLNRSHAQNAAKIAGLAALVQGGTLVVTNAGPDLQLGDTFKLFDAANYQNSFTTLNLPAPGIGMQWSNNLGINGTLTVVTNTSFPAGTWTNDANGTWSTPANWVDGNVPGGADANAYFNAIDISADRTVTLDSSRTVGNLWFGDTAGPQNWSLTTINGSTLTLAVSAGSPTVTVEDNSATISLPLAGTAGLVKSGDGTLVLSGANTYTGDVTADGGTLILAGPGGGGAAATLTVGETAGVPARMALVNGANITNSYVTLGGSATAPGAIFQSGGTFTQSGGANIADCRVGGANGYGYYNLSGGTLNVNEIGVGSDQTGSVGVMDMSGGNYLSGGYVTLARGIDSLGALNVAGGTMTLAGTVGNSVIGLMWNGTGASYGELNLFNGGSIIGPDNATYLLNYNPFSSGGTAQTGVVNLNAGGRLQIGGVMNSAPVIGTSLFNFNGGTLQATVANPDFFPDSLSGAYIFDGGATIDDNGAAVTIGEPLLAPAGYGVRSIALADGGSNYLGAPFVLISGGSGTGATAIAQVNFSTGQITNLLVTSPGSGYAIPDTLTVTLHGGGGSGANPGAVSLAANTSGGLTKTGAGTLTLAGANTYAGITVVSHGTLLLSGSLAGGAVVAGGATLSGNGTIAGAVTNQAGGTLQPGLGGADTSTLAVSNELTLAGTTVMTLNRTNAQSASRLTGIQTLTLGGTLTVLNAGPPLQADDSFTLFDAATTQGAFDVINLPALAAGLRWTNLIAVNGSVAVVSTAPPTNPVVGNLPASRIFATSATLNGRVISTGGQIPNITVYYGTSDGGTNAAAWSRQISVGAATATFTALAAGLETNTTYYFTAFAANSAGGAWAAPSQSFTTLAANPIATPVNMLTYHNDNTRCAANTHETLLTPANVNTNTFGKLFSYAVDGYVYTQPLIMTNLTIPGKGVHNVVFVATEHDTVYAFDADSNAGPDGGLLWKTNLGVAALSSNGEFGNRYTHAGYPDIVPEVGATGTPVIDPATGTLYVNAFTREMVNGVTTYFHRLHALDVTTGQERPYGPVVVAGSVPGQGVDSVGGVMTFSAIQHNQRPALALAGGRVYVGYAGYADTDPYHGWLFAYNATNLTLATNYIFNSTPNASSAAFGSHAAEGGIWQGGGGPCFDDATNIYFMTGNGSFSANTNGGDYADTFLKLSTTNGLRVADYFTPYNQAALQAADLDLGSCGPVLLPDDAGSAAHPHLLVGSGKDGKIYLLDRDNLGKYQAGSDSQIVQSIGGAIGYIWSPPAYFNRRLYFQASSSSLRAFSISNGVMSSSAIATAGPSFGAFNGGPVISANGTNEAIVWVLNSAAFASSGPGVLYAYNATNLATLYSSSQLLARDNPGGAVKLTSPTVAGGKVYVPAQYALSVYGVQMFLDAPIITPGGGAFTNQVTITLSDASPNVSLYYTVDGTVPTTGSRVYTGPFVLTSNAVVQALAAAPGAVNSAVASASFVNTAAQGNGIGLKGEYFASHTSASPFTGSPTLVGTNSAINFDWGVNGPNASVGKTNFTVRWTGCVQPQFSENYTFTTTADDGVRLYVNGRLLVDDWTDKTNAASASNSVPLVAQQLYNLELDYYQKTNNASVSLSWSSPSTPFGIIPQTQLYPFTNPPPAVVLTAPANGSGYTASASVTISAEADAQYNPVRFVNFQTNGILLGSVINAPYTLTATGLAAGSYALAAVAVDGSGLSNTSSVVNITINSGTGLPYGLASRQPMSAFLNMPITSGGSIPPLLSEVGIFSNTAAMTPVAGLIPYQPNTPLWSDGALKTRYFAVPGGGGAITPDQQIAFAPTGSWTFPAGSVFVKTFELNTDTTQPGVKRRLETRVLVRDANGQVYGATYKWRPDNSDADLLYSSLNEDILITNATGVTTQTWYYPSPSDCLTCHTPAAHYVLGLSTRQLNGNETYPSTGVTDNQLRTLNHLGVFNPAFNETNIAGFARMSSLANLSASLEDRVRSYLDANCAQCHQPGGIGPTFDARYDTPLASQNLINGALDSNGYAMIKPRDIWRSEIWQRMNTTNNAVKMPPLARNLIDTNAVQVLADWINSLPGVPALAPPTLTPNGGSFVASVNVSVQPPDTNAVIYYTLDGSSPTTNSLRYHGPVTLLDSATVAASSFRPGYVNSVAASAYFLVEPLHFTTQGFTNDVFQLMFAGSTGSNYVLQATTNLIDWTPIATNTATSNHFNFYDANATNYPYRFYRVKKQ